MDSDKLNTIPKGHWGAKVGSGGWITYSESSGVFPKKQVKNQKDTGFEKWRDSITEAEFRILRLHIDRLKSESMSRNGHCLVDSMDQILNKTEMKQ